MYTCIYNFFFKTFPIFHIFSAEKCLQEYAVGVRKRERKRGGGGLIKWHFLFTIVQVNRVKQNGIPCVAM